MFFQCKKIGNTRQITYCGEGSYKTTLKKLAQNDKDILFLGLRNDIADILSILIF